MQSAVIYSLLYASIAARIAVVVRGVFGGLLRAYPFFFATVLLSLARALVSVATPLAYYRWFLGETQWPLAVLEAAAVLEAFWGVAAHFRKIRGFGWILVGVIAAISALASALVGILRATWHDPLNGMLLFGMYVYVALLVAALLSLGFFSQFRAVPIRPNSTLHLTVIALWFGLYFLGNFIGQVSRGTSRFLPNMIITAGATLALFWWAAAMNRDGQKLPEPATAMSVEQFEASEAEYRRKGDRIRRAGAQAFRRMFRG